MSIVCCEDCERNIDLDYSDAVCIEEAGVWICDGCYESEFEKQRKYWEPLYRGEKAAGMLPTNHYKQQ